MLTTSEFADAITEETRLIRHLATKIDPARADWRPSADQRSTIELLRYLALCGIVPVRAMLAGDWGAVGELSKKHDGLELEDFDAAMVEQESALRSALAGIDASTWETQQVPLPWGETVPLGKACYLTSLRFLIAYRMQLFLYAKQSGGTKLSTHNAWLGTDPPAEA